MLYLCGDCVYISSMTNGVHHESSLQGNKKH